jgi:hypothetical protein
MPKPKLELPDFDEPLDSGEQPVAPPGRRIVAIPSSTEAIAIIEGTRRKLSDLPIAPKHLNPIACICLYTMYGLDLQEIAVATGLPIDQITAIRMSNEYTIMQRAVIDSVLEAETGAVKDYIKKATFKAAQKVERQIDHINEDVAFRAAKDVLDRAGLRPADVVEHRGRMDMGLVIEVVDRKQDRDRPVIDITPEG